MLAVKIFSGSKEQEKSYFLDFDRNEGTELHNVIFLHGAKFSNQILPQEK